jgi:CheY-like chemotaxis protein/MinD-like ATPase involved in chromosome partitioning or flagellar assembly
MPERILVVDDDVDTLRLVGLMLQRQGYHIIAASSGRQALSMARSDDPDLIILDVMMPDMDGYEVTRRLRADQATAAIPIIMFTAKSQIDDKVTGFEVGADDYLTKPTQPRELFAHVRAVLARTSKGRPAMPSPVATAAVERAHVIGILSARGGLGVTTTTLNLGITIRSRTSKNVIVAEYRPGSGTMGLDLGFLKPQGLNNILERRPSEISPQLVQPHLIAHNSGVHFLLASYQSSDAKHLANVEGFVSLTKTLSLMTNYLVLDLGPAITPPIDKVLTSCDELVVVTEPHPYTVKQTKALLQDLVGRGFSQGRVRVILVNRSRSDVVLSTNVVQEELDYPVAVTFTPAPEILYQASIRNNPVVLYQADSLSAQQFGRLADLLIQPSR